MRSGNAGQGRRETLVIHNGRNEMDKKLSAAHKAILLMGATSEYFNVYDMVEREIRKAKKHTPSGTLPEHKAHNDEIERKRQAKLLARQAKRER